MFNIMFNIVKPFNCWETTLKQNTSVFGTFFRTPVEARGYVAEAALWVKAWRHQGQLQALIETRVLVVSTDQLFKVLQGYANCPMTPKVENR